ncbi:lantibiotic modifying-like protein [Microbispora hainanensis]|jgi:lantibiotic modifying enzyme|uniref:Lantibiotic modifying-like protein n=1 Tax=Microbispora hainanensis TaxID=568844 RepID=A0ABZ1SRD6_9ACTN|nr:MULTISPECIES: lanthionine synthetase LanC family protein [Microbispora]NJP23815.1 lantibiotic modifying-like protein [Microbispora sp. CL1-1]TQS15349.1 lantibiotic modifying-like protein [Microbispora sp. SCL1-1]
MSAWPRETPVTAAVTAARWVRSAAVDDDLGRRWRANPDPRGRSAGAGDASSLYAGAAGVVLFFLELAAATGHEAYLEDALAGARRLAVTWPEQRDPTFYHGLAGLVFAMAETGWATGDEEVFGAARAAADRLVRDARPLGDGIGWTGDPAQRGDGGIVLALLHAAGILGVPAYEEVAIEAGHRIAALAVPGHRFGGDAIPDLPVDAVTPGFLSGTAGTAFLLARLYGVTRDERFLEAARRGAGFVRAVSVVTDRCALVPHHIPQGRRLHYLGFCSGSAGVARMFYELHRVTGDPGDLDWVERLAHGIMQSGVPGARPPGHWDVACLCCGTAGLIECFVGLYAATGHEPYLGFARTLAIDLIGRATAGDEAGFRWYQAYRRLRPGEVTADTGYMVGAAGIGTALLHLDATERAATPRRLILLPDNPFPAIPIPAAVLRGDQA